MSHEQMCEWNSSKYLQELVLKTHNTTLRSSSQLKLPISKSNLSFIHKSSFSSMGPRIWNSLPQHLRCAENLDTFKGLLKTTYLSVLTTN